MSDWAVGDLAVTTEGVCPECDIGCGYIPPGVVCRVTRVEHEPGYEIPSLWITGHVAPGGYGWCACGFRKIAPDEHEGEREDWELLLDSMKRRVRV